MPAKQNCWEMKKCGREPGGVKTPELGLCPASTDKTADGLNGGKNDGRICWAVTGTFCGGKIQGTFAEKQLSCMSYEFYKRVRDEEGAAGFRMLKPGQTYKHGQRSH